MSYRMKKRLHTLLVSIFLFLVVIIFIILGKKQPEGEYITKEEMVVLTELLNTVWDEHVAGEDADSAQMQREAMAVLEEMVSGWEVEEYVTYNQFNQWKNEIEAELDVLGEEEDEYVFINNNELAEYPIELGYEELLQNNDIYKNGFGDEVK